MGFKTRAKPRKRIHDEPDREERREDARTHNISVPVTQEQHEAITAMAATTVCTVEKWVFEALSAAMDRDNHNVACALMQQKMHGRSLN